MNDDKPNYPGQEPGLQHEMTSKPQEEKPEYRGSGKLQDKVAIITGADSGIGRSVAIYFAKEGADIINIYLNEHQDAEETKRQVEKEGQKCLNISGNIGDEDFCQIAVKQAVEEFGKIDILVNNAGEQHPQEQVGNISQEQLEQTFRTNFFAQVYMVKAVLPHLKEGSAIINTTSVTAYRGSPELLDYSATKGAIVAFTRSLSQSLAKKKIRVNAVAPGPIWTPLIPSTFKPEHVEKFGKNTALGRAGQPEEVAPSFVFLASNIDSSYITGQVLHPNGGEMVES